jgi:pimeloyl-ACP methyl ester carboxylesterase
VAVCQRGEARIGYEDLAGRGAPLLLGHGGLHERMNGPRFWTAPGVAGPLATAGYRVLLPDRRWSGGATEAPVAAHTWTLEAEDLAGVLRHAGAGPALLVAGSNGCSAALRLAVDQPDLVAGLVLAWPVAPRDRLLEAAFERSAAFVASAGPVAYLDELRAGVPAWESPRPGLAFGVALTTDEAARATFPLLSGGQAASLMRRSAADLFAGETVRGVTDEELRSVGASGLTVAVIAPATDGPFHTRAVAERLASQSGAAPPGRGFPETPSPGFAATRERFNAELLTLLAGNIRPVPRRGPSRLPPVSGSPAAPAGEDEPRQHETPEQ